MDTYAYTYIVNFVVEVYVEARRDSVLHDVGGGLGPIYPSISIYIYTYICIYIYI